MYISILGIGFVGSAIEKSFKLKGINVVSYDKYKNIGTFEDCLGSDISFLCLPTQFNETINKYDNSSINEVLGQMNNNNYKGLIVIKSTVEPQTINELSNKYKELKIMHNPEFLTARTAFEDFHNQKHIVLGKGSNIQEQDVQLLQSFYKEYYPEAEISICNSTESESMKVFVNCFYAVKIQFFNELYVLCNKMNCDYNTVKDLMLKNDWIKPNHTNVPGPDGKLSYGGCCFPKDTNALLHNMKKHDSPHGLLEACIKERNKMRNDNVNIISNDKLDVCKNLII
jgi:nucleotide sugar dehydrogenase